MLQTLVNAFKSKDVRKKMIFTLILLFIYRIGAWMPLPGVDVAQFAAGVVGEGGFFELLSSISGGALENGAILALGVAPYINSSIIVQLLTFIIPSWQAMSKQGDAGKKRIQMYTRIGTLVMSIAQAVGIVLAFNSDGLLFRGVWQGAPEWVTGVIVVMLLVAGGLFVMWLGERITEKGVGNGLSLILFVGILSTAGTMLYRAAEGAVDGNLNYLWNILIFLVAVLVIFTAIVFIDLSQRKIPVQYSNQMRGRKMYGGQATHIPIKINSSGVMPIIFTMAIVGLPQIMMAVFWPTSTAYEWYSDYMGMGSWPYIVITSVMIFGFTFFYNQLIFNPEDVARQIQQNGGFIPTIRPGKPMVDYLKKVTNRITFFGAIFLATLALVPALVFKGLAGDAGLSNLLVNSFSATGLLIVVTVALEFNRQLEAQLLSKQYRGFLNK